MVYIKINMTTQRPLEQIASMIGLLVQTAIYYFGGVKNPNISSMRTFVGLLSMICRYMNFPLTQFYAILFYRTFASLNNKISIDFVIEQLYQYSLQYGDRDKPRDFFRLGMERFSELEFSKIYGDDEKELMGEWENSLFMSKIKGLILIEVAAYSNKINSDRVRGYKIRDGEFVSVANNRMLGQTDQSGITHIPRIIHDWIMNLEIESRELSIALLADIHQLDAINSEVLADNPEQINETLRRPEEEEKPGMISITSLIYNYLD